MNHVHTDVFISALRDAGLTKAEAERILSVFIDRLRKSLIEGDELHIKGFGKFVKTYRPEKYRNVFGTVRKVPERRGVRFQPFKALLEAINPQ